MTPLAISLIITSMMVAIIAGTYAAKVRNDLRQLSTELDTACIAGTRLMIKSAEARRQHARSMIALDSRAQDEIEDLAEDLRKASALHTKMEHERNAYRAMVCDLLASAYPHLAEHPAMTAQWEGARELLKHGPRPLSAKKEDA